MKKGVYINGRHTKRGEPYYSLKVISHVAQIPVYKGQKDAKVVFNWGGGGFVAPRGATVLNRKFVHGGKYRQSQFMLKAGCKTPQSWKYLKNIPAGSFPVLEKLERSQGGKGIILLRRKPNRGQPKARWYQKYIDKKREYRVFFFLDDITMVNEKIPKDRSQVTWNLHNSSWSGAYGLKGNANLKKIVLAGTKALNLDWGAADVLEDTRGNFWICEINSRPGCQNPGGEKARFRRNKNGIYEPVEGHAGGGSASMWANQFRKFLEKH
jgi:hypothetical protein